MSIILPRPGAARTGSAIRATGLTIGLQGKGFAIGVGSAQRIDHGSKQTNAVAPAARSRFPSQVEPPLCG
jgi:hypothetical protein